MPEMEYDTVDAKKRGNANLKVQVNQQDLAAGEN